MKPVKLLTEKSQENISNVSYAATLAIISHHKLLVISDHVRL